MTTRYEQATKGLTVTRDGGVVKVSDGEDTWLCRTWAWEAARSALDALPAIPGEDGEAQAYGALCTVVASPVVSTSGTSLGTKEDRRALVTAAIERELISESHPLAKDR